MKDTLLKFTSRNQITDRWLEQNPDVIIECWGCSKPIQKDDPRRKFCDRNCAKRYWRAVKKVPIYKYCDWCGDEFIANRSDKIYDDINCARAASRKRRGIPVLAEMEKPCGECKTIFNPSHIAQKYCTLECFIVHRLGDKREYNHWKRNGEKRKRGYTKRYRDWLRKEIKVSIENVKAIHEAPAFDKDEWNKRAQDVVSRLSKKYA